MNVGITELYRARAIVTIGDERIVGPWVEYGPTAMDGVRHAINESSARLFRDLHRTARHEGEAQKRDDEGRWPDIVSST